MSATSPLVSVITAVYNGEKYLVECIESVLAQTYRNFEYVIVNNCSTDKTLEIAQAYANKDERIRVINNSEYVGAIQNHNIACRQISPQSKYCKVVCADDWINVECISRMVHLAEDHPSVAIVGAYAINRDGTNYVGLPPERSVFRGSEVCRFQLLGGPLVMGAPSAILYRSDIVRPHEQFYPGTALSADISACYRSLQHHDFGFVHQILSFERIHNEALNDEQFRLKAFELDRIAFLAEYGRIFLTSEEFEERFIKVLDYYYCRILVPAFLKRYPEKFWKYHMGRLEEIGVKFDRNRLLRALTYKIIDLLCNPKKTVEKMLKRRSVFEERNGTTVRFSTISVERKNSEE